MKKILATLAALAALFTTAYSQTVTGTFAPLKDQARVKMVINFSEADIMGMSEDEFRDFEKDWEKDKPTILAHFYSAANVALGGVLMVGNYKFETDYTLLLQVRSVDSRGNYDCDLTLFRNGEDGEEIIGDAAGLFARGGVFGTKLNLMKDGARHTGVLVGKFLREEMAAGRDHGPVAGKSENELFT